MCMEKPQTTVWKNVEGRAEFLQRVDERLNCGDIEGQILTEAGRYAYALSEYIGELQAKITQLETRMENLEKRIA